MGLTWESFGSPLFQAEILMNYLELISRAVTSPHGIEIETNNPSALRQKFYAEIRKMPMPRPNLKLNIVNNKLWILKNGTEKT